MTTHSLGLEGVTKYYPNGQVIALDAVTVRVTSREFVAITGPSGAGKSTLMALLGLLDIPTEGVVAFDGHDIAQWSPRVLARQRGQRIGFVFQESHLLWDRTALENVELRLRYAGVPRTSRTDLAIGALRSVGLEPRQLARVATLSGGERQRVALASAIAPRPAFLLCDEPTGNLDTANTDRVLRLLAEANGLGMAIVLVTHNIEVARAANRRIVMRDGRIVGDEHDRLP